MKILNLILQTILITTTIFGLAFFFYVLYSIVIQPLEAKETYAQPKVVISFLRYPKNNLFCYQLTGEKRHCLKIK